MRKVYKKRNSQLVQIRTLKNATKKKEKKNNNHRWSRTPTEKKIKKTFRQWIDHREKEENTCVFYLGLQNKGWEIFYFRVLGIFSLNQMYLSFSEYQ